MYQYSFNVNVYILKVVRKRTKKEEDPLIPTEYLLPFDIELN